MSKETKKIITKFHSIIDSLKYKKAREITLETNGDICKYISSNMKNKDVKIKKLGNRIYLIYKNDYLEYKFLDKKKSSSKNLYWALVRETV